MIPNKIKEHLDNYIHQEVYVQIAVIKGKEKISTKAAIESYFNSNHFRDLSCLLYTSPSPRDRQKSRMPSSA